MSGGHFNYDCFAISRFADDLRHELDINDSQEKDTYGGNVGAVFLMLAVTLKKPKIDFVWIPISAWFFYCGIVYH